jgi:hypothetical protein
LIENRNSILILRWHEKPLQAEGAMKSMCGFAVAAILCGVTLAASAQTLPYRGVRQMPEGFSSVSSTISLTFPYQKDGDAKAAEQAALRSFYQIAAANCRLLTETVAANCELWNLSSSVRMSDRGQSGPQLELTGQITMKVSFKPGIGSGTP